VRIPWAVTVALLVVGCADPVTEVFACYGVAPSLRRPGGELRVCARTLDGSRVLFGCDGSDLGGLVAERYTQGYVRNRADGVSLEIEADVPMGGTLVTAQQAADVPFVEGRIVDVALRIEEPCMGVSCAVGETCALGVCVATRIEPDCLPDHGTLSACPDGRVNRPCE